MAPFPMKKPVMIQRPEVRLIEIVGQLGAQVGFKGHGFTMDFHKGSIKGSVNLHGAAQFSTLEGLNVTCNSHEQGAGGSAFDGQFSSFLAHGDKRNPQAGIPVSAAETVDIQSIRGNYL